MTQYNTRFSLMAAALLTAMQAPVISAHPSVEVARDPGKSLLSRPPKSRKLRRKRLARATGPGSYDEMARQRAAQRVAEATGQPLMYEGQIDGRAVVNGQEVIIEHKLENKEDLSSWF